jgi:hypothetical protein
MANKNYVSGRSYEQRFVNERLKNGACVSKRFYASKGATDVYWVNGSGAYFEAQLKYSKTVPVISKKERVKLEEYAKKMPFPVYLIMKAFRKPAEVEQIQ